MQTINLFGVEKYEGLNEELGFILQKSFKQMMVVDLSLMELSEKMYQMELIGTVPGL